MGHIPGNFGGNAVEAVLFRVVAIELLEFTEAIGCNEDAFAVAGEANAVIACRRFALARQHAL